MAQVFFPQVSVTVPAACPPHPQGTEYKISIGIEMWDNVPVKGLKIQMVYNGKVSGRRSPTYPNVEDYRRVHAAIEELLKDNCL